MASLKDFRIASIVMPAAEIEGWTPQGIKWRPAGGPCMPALCTVLHFFPTSTSTSTSTSPSTHRGVVRPTYDTMPRLGNGSATASPVSAKQPAAPQTKKAPSFAYVIPIDTSSSIFL